MEFFSCKKCCRAFSEKCRPLFLDCGHSVCSDCVCIFVNNEKECPYCYVKLSKPWKEYKTNFALLWISEKMLLNNSLLLDLTSLESKKNLLLSMKDISEKLIEIESSFQNAALDFIDQFQKLMQRSPEISHESDAKDLIEDIDNHLGQMDNGLDHACDPTLRNILHLKKDMNKNKILCLLQHHLHLDKKIFACEIVGNLLWKYGQVTFSEDRIHVHCLSSSTLEKGASVVSVLEGNIDMVSEMNLALRRNIFGRS